MDGVAVDQHVTGGGDRQPGQERDEDARSVVVHFVVTESNVGAVLHADADHVGENRALADGDAEGVDVAAGVDVDLVELRLFGPHVLQRADDAIARDRHALDQLHDKIRPAIFRGPR